MRKRTKPDTPVQARGSSWTFGRQMSAKFVTVGLVAAILCGPIAVVLAMNSASRPIAVAETATSAEGITADQQRGGAYALGYVSAWLSATRDAPGELGQYIDLSAIRQISTVPWEYRDLAVASIEPAGDDALSVVVSANVRELASTDGGDTTADVWPRRYFQTTVRMVQGASRVVGLPAPVAGPLQADTATLVYSQSLAPSSAAHDAVLSFLGAYLAESGEISRYIAPGTRITAISPAPFVAVDALDLRVDNVPGDDPADGDELRVLGTVALTSITDQRLTSSYALTMTARAGRWEVTSIDPAPQQTASPRTDSPKPTPSASPEGK